MRQTYWKAFPAIILVGITFFLPQSSSAFSVTFLDPAYTASDFFTVPTQTYGFAFDANLNLYTGVGITGTTATINEYIAPTYGSSSSFASYTTNQAFITGLNFYGTGDMAVSEAGATGNFGAIKIIDPTTSTPVQNITLSSFRPTGITSDSSGNIYFPGRLNSDTHFGNIYEISSGGSVPTLLTAFVATGIAYGSGGYVFVSTAGPGADLNPTHIANSIYKINLATLSSSLFATLDAPIEELTFDKSGNLYAISSGATPDILKISAVPEPSTLLLLGSGLAGLGGMAWRRRRTRRDT